MSPNTEAHTALSATNFAAWLFAKREEFWNYFQEHDAFVSIDGHSTKLRFIFIKSGSDGEPLIDPAVKWLRTWVAEYAIRGQDFPLLDEISSAKLIELHTEAATRFTKRNDSGEVGEMLLWCLLEAVCKAPQAVAKMAHKDSYDLEITGADAIHANWDPDANVLNIWFGESKIHDDAYGGIRAAFKDLNDMVAVGGLDEDWNLLTTHPSQLAPELEKRIKAYRDNPSAVNFEIKTSWAILVGFSWEHYTNLSKQQFSDARTELRRAFIEYAPKLQTWIETQLKTTAKNAGHELLVFLLPLKSAAELRTHFARRLSNR